MAIYDLRDYPEYLETLAEWHHAEWTELNPGQTLEQRVEKMQAYLRPEFIPSTYVYVEGGQLCGSAAIIESDMETHPELTPWLASVFVAPEMRGKGIGSALVNHVAAKAREHGLKTLYLFTPDQEKLYQRLGWELRTHENYCGCEVALMGIDLSGKI